MPIRSKQFLLPLFPIVLIGVGACGDLETAPPVELGTEEIVPSLFFGQALPSFPGLLDRWGRALPLDEPAREWTSTWEGDPAGGERRRSELYRGVLPSLAREIPEGELSRMLRSVEVVLAEVDARFGGALPRSLGGPLAEARAAHTDALTAHEAGDRAGALGHLLAATDHLRRTTPGQIARALIEEAEAALERSPRSAVRRIPPSEPYGGQRFTRAERLLIGARLALDEGQDALALRRAYYAHRLLTESP